MGNVRDERRQVAEAGHDAGDHAPAEGGTVQSPGLVDYWADAVRLDDAPDEERDARDWGYYGFHSE